jgi:hypothetical protein
VLAAPRIIARVMIKAATAVAARIVKNQYKRFPRSKKGLGLGVCLGGTTWRERARAACAPARLRGEIHGKIVWAWLLFNTPDRPYNTSATSATTTSSRKPILIPQHLEVELAPTARSSVEPFRHLLTSAQREHRTIRQWYNTSAGRNGRDRQHGGNSSR